MTDEKLAAIRKSVEFQARVAQARDDNSDALLAEVDRLHGELAALVESFDKLSAQYDAARERWQKKMARLQARVEQLEDNLR